MVNHILELFHRYIGPSENKIVAIIASGEGWHNYHHVFPWDYKTSELGNYNFNTTASFIDFFARIGWAYELKTVPPKMIKSRVQRTGDGSHNLWGWGDKDQCEQEKQDAIITNQI